VLVIRAVRRRRRRAQEDAGLDEAIEAARRQSGPDGGSRQ
jgi:hypothetical protein